jgi:hypothetical protein
MDLPFNGVGLTKKKGGVGPGPGGGGTGSRPPSPTESDQAVSCFACRCCKPATPKDNNMVSRSIVEIALKNATLMIPTSELAPASIPLPSLRRKTGRRNPFLSRGFSSLCVAMPMLTDRRVGDLAHFNEGFISVLSFKNTHSTKKQLLTPVS